MTFRNEEKQTLFFISIIEGHNMSKGDGEGSGSVLDSRSRPSLFACRKMVLMAVITVVTIC